MTRFKYKSNNNAISNFNNSKDYIFLDLEFDQFTNENKYYEITSIGAIKCNKSFKNLNCFHYYTKPISYEINSKNKQNDFCTIKKVKSFKGNAISFTEAINKLAIWLKNTNCNIFTWGEQDSIVLQMNLEATSLHEEFSWVVDRIVNIQPIVCSSVKVLGSPVNYTISLNNMKKLFNLKRDVSHNALLDSIDLMNVYKRYKNDEIVNQEFLKEISYVYKNIDTTSQFKNLKNIKQNKIHNNIDSRVLIKGPSKEILEQTLDVLRASNFKFTNEHPKFYLNDDKQEVLFNKALGKDSFEIFDTTQNECTFNLEKDKIIINLLNGEEQETLIINKNDISLDYLEKLEHSIKLSSIIERDKLIKNDSSEAINLLNDIFSNYTSNYTDGIKGINIDRDQLILKKVKDPNLKVSMYDSNIFIKNNENHYDIIFKWDCLYKKSESQAIFTVLKTNATRRIISQIIIHKNIDKMIPSNRYVVLDDTAKEYVIALAKEGAFKTKRKSSVFANSERLSFLYGKYAESINLEGASYFIENRKTPFIVLETAKDKKRYELRISKNKNSAPTIKKLFKYYKKNKSYITRVNTSINSNLKLLNELCSSLDFDKVNTHKYSITQNHIFFNRNSEPEYYYEKLSLSDFDIHITLNSECKPSLVFINRMNTKNTFSTGVSFKKLTANEMLILTKEDFLNSNIDSFKLQAFSNNLTYMLKDLNNNNGIHFNKDFLKLYIDNGRIKLKKRSADFNKYHLKEISLEIINSKNITTIKLFNDTDLYFYTINSNTNKEPIVNLCNDIKKAKSNSWIKVLKINRSLRNSIWRVLDENNYFSTKPLTLDNHYIKAGKQKYIYEQTPLSLKQIDSNKIKLKIGHQTNGITCDISINDKNRYFIDDLINNTLLYERENLYSL